MIIGFQNLRYPLASRTIHRLPRSKIDLFPPLGIAKRMRFPLLLQLLLQGELVAMELRAEEGFGEWAV